MSALNMYIEKVEDNSMGQVTKAAVVDRDSLPSVDHLSFLLAPWILKPMPSFTLI